MNYLFLMIGLFTHGTMAFAAEAGYMSGVYIDNQSTFGRIAGALPDWGLVLIPVALAIVIGCRALAEILLLLKDVIPGDTEIKAAQTLRRVADIGAKILAYVGVGVPKKIVEEKVAAKAKEAEQPKVES